MAVEVAVVLPILLTILLGLLELARLVEVRQVIGNSAREAGRQASTGQKTTAEVQQIALRYLQESGLDTSGAAVTVTNLTSSSRSDPATAKQLDRMRIVVTIPFDDVRWIVLGNLTNASEVRAESVWTSMQDLPVVVSGTIPIE